MLSVEVARLIHRHEAETAVAFLEDAGIAVKLAADDCGGAHPGLLFTHPARLLVAPQDAEPARKVLVGAGIPVVGDE